MLNKLLNDILNYRILTKVKFAPELPAKYYMNYTRSNGYGIDEEIALSLIHSEVVVNYRYEYQLITPHLIGQEFILRGSYPGTNIGKINFMLETINPNIFKSDIIIEELKRMKNIEERKLKIHKINKL